MSLKFYSILSEKSFFSFNRLRIIAPLILIIWTKGKEKNDKGRRCEKEKNKVQTRKEEKER